MGVNVSAAENAVRSQAAGPGQPANEPRRGVFRHRRVSQFQGRPQHAALDGVVAGSDSGAAARERSSATSSRKSTRRYPPRRSPPATPATDVRSTGKPRSREAASWQPREAGPRLHAEKTHTGKHHGGVWKVSDCGLQHAAPRSGAVEQDIATAASVAKKSESASQSAAENELAFWIESLKAIGSTTPSAARVSLQAAQPIQEGADRRLPNRPEPDSLHGPTLSAGQAPAKSSLHGAPAGELPAEPVAESCSTSLQSRESLVRAPHNDLPWLNREQNAERHATAARWAETQRAGGLSSEAKHHISQALEYLDRVEEEVLTTETMLRSPPPTGLAGRDISKLVYAPILIHPDTDPDAPHKLYTGTDPLAQNLRVGEGYILHPDRPRFVTLSSLELEARLRRIEEHYASDPPSPVRRMRKAMNSRLDDAIEHLNRLRLADVNTRFRVWVPDLREWGKVGWRPGFLLGLSDRHTPPDLPGKWVELDHCVVPGSALGEQLPKDVEKPESYRLQEQALAEYKLVPNLARTVLRDTEGRTIFSGLRHDTLDALDFDDLRFGIRDFRTLRVQQRPELAAACVRDLAFPDAPVGPGFPTREEIVNECLESRQIPVDEMRTLSCRNKARLVAAAALAADPERLQQAISGKRVCIELFCVALNPAHTKMPVLHNQWLGFAALSTDSPVPLQVRGPEGMPVTVRADVKVRQFTMGSSRWAPNPGRWSTSPDDPTARSTMAEFSRLLGGLRSDGLEGDIKARIDEMNAAIKEMKAEISVLKRERSHIHWQPDPQESVRRIWILNNEAERLGIKVRTLISAGQQLKNKWIDSINLSDRINRGDSVNRDHEPFKKGGDYERDAAVRLALIGHLMGEIPVMSDCDFPWGQIKHLDRYVKSLATTAHFWDGNIPNGHHLDVPSTSPWSKNEDLIAELISAQVIGEAPGANTRAGLAPGAQWPHRYRWAF